MYVRTYVCKQLEYIIIILNVGLPLFCKQEESQMSFVSNVIHVGALWKL